MEVYFTVQGRRIVGTKEQVEVALRGVRPERVRVHGVTVGTETYPVTQALATAFDLPRKACAPHVARRVLGRLGFKLSETGNRPKRRGTRKRMHEALPDRRYELGPVEDEFFALPRIHLAWSRWERWEDIDEHSVAILDMPLCKSGVYEAKQSDNEARLTIGRASDLRTRILNGLVRGAAPHTAGDKIRKEENLKQVVIRWAPTDRPAAVEEHLHQRHIKQFGRLPKHTVRT